LILKLLQIAVSSPSIFEPYAFTVKTNHHSRKNKTNITMKKTLTIVFMTTLISLGAQNIELPQPIKTGGMPLMEALAERRTSREFTEKEIELQTLSNLLWAAYGFNRPDENKRTAPTSRNYQEMEVYVAVKSGLYYYDAANNMLIQIHNKDVRANTGLQEYVATAPLNLIYVANQQKVQDPHGERQLKASHTNSGFIAQNVYLYCASEGLASVVRAWFDEDDLQKAMQLGDDYKIILTQTVGYMP
jgi:SagB-type dehydrogenase family enzyme